MEGKKVGRRDTQSIYSERNTVCQISDPFVIRVPLLVLLYIFFYKAQWGTKGKTWLIRSVLKSFLHTDHASAEKKIT